MDALITVISYSIAWVIRFIIVPDPTAGALGPEIYFSALFLVVPGYLLLNHMANMYTSKRYASIERDVYGVVQSNVILMIIFLSSLYMIDQKYFSRSLIIMFCVINIFLGSLARAVVRKTLRTMRKKGYNVKYVLLVGYSRAAEEYIDRIQANPQWGYVVRGILDDKIPRGTLYKGVKVIGRIDNLLIILPENKLDEIAITLALEDYDILEEIVQLCEKSGVHTKFIPDYNSIIPSKPYTEDLNGLPVINIRHIPLSNTLNSIAKRIVDMVGGIFCIILFSPVMLFAAVAIKVTSPGPVIFKRSAWDCIISRFGFTNSGRWRCKNQKRSRRLGRQRMTRVSPKSEGFFERQALMKCRSFSMC